MGLLGVRSVDFSSYDERAPVQFSATRVLLELCRKPGRCEILQYEWQSGP